MSESFAEVRKRMRKTLRKAIKEARMACGVTMQGDRIEHWTEERVELKAKDAADLYALLFENDRSNSTRTDK